MYINVTQKRIIKSAFLIETRKAEEYGHWLHQNINFRTCVLYGDFRVIIIIIL